MTDNNTDDLRAEIIRQAKESERDKYNRQQRELIAVFVAATTTPDVHAEEYEFPIDPPLYLDHPLAGHNVFTRVKVSVTIPLQPKDDDDEPFYSAHGWAHELTTKGEPHGQRSPGWYPLPDNLAKPLLDLGRAAKSTGDGDDKH